MIVPRAAQRVLRRRTERERARERRRRILLIVGFAVAAAVIGVGARRLSRAMRPVEEQIASTGEHGADVSGTGSAESLGEPAASDTEHSPTR
jgi:hypothetical protein